MSSRRLFTAVLPSPDAADSLRRQLPTGEQPGVRWSDPATWHVTLLFTPQVDESLLEPLCGQLAGLAGETPPFPLAIAGGGAFPRIDAARHLIALLDDATGSLPDLAAGCRRIASGLGIEHPDKAYQPHLTLARMNRPVDAGAGFAWLGTLATPHWQVGRIALVESVLSARGPAHHRVLQDFALGRR